MQKVYTIYILCDTMWDLVLLEVKDMKRKNNWTVKEMTEKGVAITSCRTLLIANRLMMKILKKGGSAIITRSVKCI